MSADPWSAFLEWLNTVLTPAWGELVGLLPYFLILGVVGPIVTLIGLMWVWYLLHRTPGHVRRSEVQAIAAPRGDDGVAVYAPNQPYCDRHALIYPPRATTCEIDREDLSVRCPVDGSVRDASVQVCPACGTGYVLGATSGPLAIADADGPPGGGAAVA